MEDNTQHISAHTETLFRRTDTHSQVSYSKMADDSLVEVVSHGRAARNTSPFCRLLIVSFGLI